MQAGILPVKSLARAKGRLTDALGDDARRELAEALFEDALILCAATEGISWWIVSDDETVRSRAERAGLGSIADRGTGLNDALRGSVELVQKEGASSVLVLPCDIPLATPEDVADILDTGATSDLVVVPSWGDGGTNALYLSPPDVIEPRFGTASLSAHVSLAAERGLRCSVLPLERLELDLDTPADLEELRKRLSATSPAALGPETPASRTLQLLARLPG